MSPGPYTGLTGPIPRDATTGAVLISSRSDGRAAAMMPTGAIAETFSRFEVTLGTATLATGALRLTAIYLQQGQVLTSATFVSGGTAAVTPTNQWFALFTAARALARQTTDDLTTAWAASTPKTLNFSSTYTVPASGLYYLGVMVAAATPPSIASATSTAAITGVAPILTGTSTGSLTTTAPNPAAAITASVSPLYGYVS